MIRKGTMNYLIRNDVKTELVNDLINGLVEEEYLEKLKSNNAKLELISSSSKLNYNLFINEALSLIDNIECSIDLKNMNNNDKIKLFESLCDKFDFDKEFMETELLTLSESFNTNNFLLEELENKEEIISEMEKVINNLKDSINLSLDYTKNYNINYITNNKNNIFLSNEDKSSFNVLKEILDKNMIRLNTFLNYLNKCNFNYFDDKNNRHEFINNIIEIGKAYLNLSFVIILFRLMYGNISMTYGSYNGVDEAFNKELTDNISKSFLAVGDFYYNSECKDKISSILMSLDPYYSDILNYLIYSNNNSLTFDRNNLFIKKSVVSIKYIHHFDNVLRSIYDISLKYNKYTEIILSKSFNAPITDAYLKKLNESLSFLFSSIIESNSDLKSMIDGSKLNYKKDLNNKSI